jgi:hypothetical protein
MKCPSEDAYQVKVEDGTVLFFSSQGLESLPNVVTGKQ